jgi:DNA-binding MarR family transcriptional regulator
MVNSDNIPLEALFPIICRNHHVFTDEEAKSLNISGQKIPCLMMIYYKPGITQEELVNIFQIDKGFIARLVRKLEDDGLVYRTRDTENRRKYHIFLTVKGEKIIPAIRDIEEKWKKIMFKGLENDEISKLMEFLNLLTENSMKTKNHF